MVKRNRKPPRSDQLEKNALEINSMNTRRQVTFH